MTHRDDAPLGAPCWIELFTSDPDRARAFYGELFGWESEAAGEEYGGYLTFTKDGTLVAGGMRNDGSQGAPDVWTVYLASADAKATADAAAAHGGQIHMTMDVPAMGVMALVADPGGAAIGVWQAEGHRGFQVLDEPGTAAWFELHTRDYDAAVRFYQDVFGWDAHVASNEPDFRYTTLGEGEGQLAGIMDASVYPDDGSPSRWSVYFGTDDVDATLEQVVALGGTVTFPAEDTPYGRLAAATDPTGTAFKLRGPNLS